ncbi:hypothetical protein [Halomonas sp. BM-2019]|uniref:hypothetical protein n=1 Tax=Halomonas sp. BM-2019 TaxID=2811227 RepID=UPI001B3C437A|nr:MAG: hypothetical protein J5F18_13030 [Halomonas sp. BM-2019]
MSLDVTAWLAGALSAGIFAYLALRASRMFMKADKARVRAGQTSGGRTRRLWVSFSQAFTRAAGWQKMDHLLIWAAVGLLAINQLIALYRLSPSS